MEPLCLCGSVKPKSAYNGVADGDRRRHARGNAAASYNDVLSAAPRRFHAPDGPAFPNGVYINDNAAASVATGMLNGEEVLVLAFRGSDDQQDWFEQPSRHQCRLSS